MSDEYVDPAGNTEAFRSFVQRIPPEPEQAPSRLPLIVGVAVLAVILLGLVLFLALG
ncbi:hypothetical protein WEI85_11860 [Actinomycetes bacterium KLBMP 9797]